jgi:EAL domain-containing protein (putative c-di-GMP-specific phosphodiesterase class I)
VLGADAFLDLVADTPLAAQLDLCVVRELAEVATVSVRDTPLALYVPLSLPLLANVRTEQYVTEIADAFHLSTEQLRLEVPRRALDAWSPALQDALDSLREIGVAFVLADVDNGADVRIAVARGFDEVSVSTEAVAEIVGIAHEHGVVVGATRVDTEIVRDSLVEAGCDLATGDYFGTAEPATDID